jgi:hypothetical protein
MKTCATAAKLKKKMTARASEPIPVKSFSRFSGSFEPIFDPIDEAIFIQYGPHQLDRKAAKIIPENRRKILLG